MGRLGRGVSVVLGLMAGLVCGSAWAQQVWRCDVAGQVRFSDKPCPGSGQPVAERSLQPNVADGLKPEAARATQGGASASGLPGAAVAPTPAGNACPGDLEVRNMQTRANSTTLGEPERQFMQDEVRRVMQCRAGRGRYTEADWAISREAQAAQTQISDRARRDARLRAEAMHTAANPEEGDRIERRHLAEDRMQRRIRLIPNPGQNPASTPAR